MPAARTGKFCHTEKNLKSAWGAVVDWVNLIAASTGSAAGFDVRPAEVKVQPRILVRRRLPHHRDGVAIRAVFIRCQFGRFQRPRQIDVARAIGKTEGLPRVTTGTKEGGDAVCPPQAHPQTRPVALARAQRCS